MVLELLHGGYYKPFDDEMPDAGELFVHSPHKAGLDAPDLSLSEINFSPEILNRHNAECGSYPGCPGGTMKLYKAGPAATIGKVGNHPACRRTPRIVMFQHSPI